MQTVLGSSASGVLVTLGLLLPAASAVQAQAAGQVYYVCPGNVFTNTITAKEAEQRGCKAREAQQSTTVAMPKPRPVPSTSPSTARINDADQRARESDAKRILDAELAKEEAALEALRREYNNGEPERRGDEVRNPQKYIDRVAEMKAAITRKEADIAALRREISKVAS
ncbi:MAG: hypothetical protein J0M20_07320 [Burkholderiales bacterium]|nr:hypothetical protein [Burkholderiales bacterium]